MLFISFPFSIKCEWRALKNVGTWNFFTHVLGSFYHMQQDEYAVCFNSWNWINHKIDSYPTHIHVFTDILFCHSKGPLSNNHNQCFQLQTCLIQRFLCACVTDGFIHKCHRQISLQGVHSAVPIPNHNIGVL